MIMRYYAPTIAAALHEYVACGDRQPRATVWTSNFECSRFGAANRRVLK